MLTMYRIGLLLTAYILLRALALYLLGSESAAAIQFSHWAALGVVVWLGLLGLAIDRRLNSISQILRSQEHVNPIHFHRG